MANWYVSSTSWGKITPWGGQQNWVTQSQTLDNAAWTKNSLTVTPDTTVAPDSTTTADTLAEVAATAQHYIAGTAASVVSGLNYVASAYVKAGTSSLVQLCLSATNFGSSPAVNFDLSLGMATGFAGTVLSFGIIPVGGGWFRIWLASLATSSGASNGPIISMINSATAARAPSYVGNASNTIIAWGLQFEPGMIPGTYMPNTTTITSKVGSFTASVGDFIRQSNPLLASERVFRCTTGGTTGANEPVATGGNPWNLTPGGTTTDGGVVWTEVTGNEAYQVAGSWRPFARLWAIAGAATGNLYVASMTKSAGGSGFVVGDIVSRSAGTAFSDVAYAVVTSVSAGAITGLSMLSGGCFTAITTTASALTAVTGSGISATATATSATNAFGASTTGDTAYVGSLHFESTSASPILFGSTAPIPSGNFSKFICVDESSAGHIPPTTADEKNTANMFPTGSTNIVWNNTIYVKGIIHTINVGLVQLNTGSANWERFENCLFRLLPGASSVKPGVGRTIWNNCQVMFSASNSGILLAGGEFRWVNSPNAIVNSYGQTNGLITSNTQGIAYIEGVDLSGMGSGKKLVEVDNGSPMSVTFVGCKFGASYILQGGTVVAPAERVDAINCDSGNTNYIDASVQYPGNLTTETTIVRTGGASDGTTLKSYKIVTTTLAMFGNQFDVFPIEIWNETVGSSVTVTVEGIWGGAAVPNNDDIWMDVSYQSDASSPLRSVATLGKASILSSNAALASSTAVWGGSVTPFKLQLSVTPQKKGLITAFVKIAKPSTTFYIDPLITLS